MEYCCCSVTQSCPTLCDPYGPQHRRPLVPHHLLKFAQVHIYCIAEPVSSSEALFSHPQSFPASGIFPVSCQFASDDQNTEAFNFSISLSNEYSGLISIKIDWFDLLALQGTLRSLLQHHSVKGSVLQHSAFCMVQVSQPYVTTGKTIALNIMQP